MVNKLVNITVQYVFLWASEKPSSRATPGSAHSNNATGKFLEKSVVFSA